MERDREAEGVEERGGGRVTLSVRRAWCGHAVGEDREKGEGEGWESPCAASGAGCFFFFLVASPHWKCERLH